MKQTFCAACGATVDLQHPHLVTRAEGGSDAARSRIEAVEAEHAAIRRHGTRWAAERIASLKRDNRRLQAEIERLRGIVDEGDEF
jgi:hypothetical protein